MSDYLTKPLELKVLGEALRRWLPAADTRPVNVAPPAQEIPWIDPTRWAELGEVDGGAGEVRRDIAQGFLAALDERLADIRRAAAVSGDRVTLFQAAHQLKGAALNVGATRLAQLCERLETRSEEQSLVEDIDAVDAAIQATRRALLQA